jgi:hypothetical protein
VGERFTVNTVDTLHPVTGKVYTIIEVPVARVVINPEDEPIAATAVLLLLHTPPYDASENTVV